MGEKYKITIECMGGGFTEEVTAGTMAEALRILAKRIEDDFPDPEGDK